MKIDPRMDQSRKRETLLLVNIFHSDDDEYDKLLKHFKGSHVIPSRSNIFENVAKYDYITRNEVIKQKGNPTRIVHYNHLFSH